jgi:hypothetical protein
MQNTDSLISVPVSKKTKVVRKINIDKIFSRFVDTNLIEHYLPHQPLNVENTSYALKRFDFNLIYLADRFIVDQIKRDNNHIVPFKSNAELGKIKFKDGTIKQICGRDTIAYNKKFLIIFGVKYIPKYNLEDQSNCGQGCDMVDISPLSLELLKKFVHDNMEYHFHKFIPKLDVTSLLKQGVDVKAKKMRKNLKYEQLKELKDDQFQQLTGINISTFHEIVDILKEADVIKKLQKNYHNKLSMENQLLLALEYFKERRTYFSLSQIYGVSPSSAFKYINWIKDILKKHPNLSGLI